MLLDQWLDIFFYNWKVKCLIPANMSFCCSLLKYVLKCKSGMYSKKKNRKHFHLTRFISVSHDGDKSFLSSGLYTIHCFGHSSCSGFLSAQTVSKGLIRIGTPTICLIEGAPKYPEICSQIQEVIIKSSLYSETMTYCSNSLE